MTTTTKKENLSAFLDDESNHFEQRRLLDELPKDDELLQTLSRYTLIGDAIRNNKQESITPPSDFLASIHARLDDEPSYNDIHIESAGNTVKTEVKTGNVYAEQQQKAAIHAWLRPAAGFAVAASITAVIALNFFPTIGSDATQQPITRTSQINQGSNVVSASEAAQPLFKAKSTMKTRIQSYIKRHVKHTPSSAIMPSVRSFSHANN